MGFREDFIWGAATASFQIEGAGDERADSIWDVMCRQPGRIYGGHDGRVACDHVHRFREDVAIMRELGIRNYRFSISWPRVMPQGTGEVDEKGLAFYSELVDCLLENGIRPFVTLYHWDLPQALQLRGGWANPDIPKWFAEYTKVVARCFGDRVKDYLTLNEPQCFVGMGYHMGTSAPGMKNTPRETMMPIVHHVLRAHGEAVRVLRELVPGVRVGVAPCGDPRIPASDDPRDIEAARAAYFACEPDEYFCVSLFSDPMMLGAYPDELLTRCGHLLPSGFERDMAVIHQPLDYYAQNIYNGRVCRCGADGRPEYLPEPVGVPRTAAGWSIHPEALYWGPRFLYERYRTPILITENGMSCHDVVSLDGQVHDPNRIDYMHRYLLALRRAAEDGVDVRGYFAWSLLDNFEWSKGYSERFGLVHVDYATQKRTIKDSARWYAGVIAENGRTL